MLNSCCMSDEKQKFTMHLPDATVDWLKTTYPDGLNTQDRLRMAVSDARLVREHRDVYLSNSDDD